MNNKYRLQVAKFAPLSLLADTKKKNHDEKSINQLSLTSEQLREMMYRMTFTRAWDKRAMGLARQGRLGFYAPVAGQEATMIGSGYAIEPDDWILPGYRDIPQLYWHGYPMYQAFLWSRGHQHGGQIPSDVQVVMPQIIIGAQYVQAVGVAMGLKKKSARSPQDKQRVVVTYTGDGGSSQGDFYEALNFAGVFKLPVVFIVQNNGYAISTSREQQTASESIAQKGLAAGIESMQVDGMDVLAVYKATSEAVERARQNLGPTLIEALNYRLEPHSMSGDDPTRYRPKEELSEWNAKEPLGRYRQYLESKSLWSDEDEQQAIDQAHAKVAEELSKAEQHPKMSMDQLIDSMYERVPDYLEKQKLWFSEDENIG